MMNTLKNRPWLAALFLSTSLCLAQPTGQAIFVFDDSNVPVWDLSGPYTLNTPIAGAGDSLVTLSYTVVINHEMSGRLLGSGETLVRIGDEVVAARYRVQGNVTGRNGDTRANFTVSLRGRDLIAGALQTINITTSYRVDVVSGEEPGLAGRVRGNASLSQSGGGPIRADNFFQPLPPGPNGSWVAILDFLPFQKLTGTATLVISAYTAPDNPMGEPGERQVQGVLNGSYSEKRNLSRVTVRSTSEKGANLNVTFTDENQLNSLSGKVLGQNLRF